MSRRNSLYFSMKRHNETQDAWLRRTESAYSCRNQSRGLSGHPDKHGYCDYYVDGETYTLSDRGEVLQGALRHGETVRVARYGYGSQYAQLTRNFALSRRFGFALIKFGSGMTARYDGIAYYISDKRDEVYSDDTH